MVSLDEKFEEYMKDARPLDPITEGLYRALFYAGAVAVATRVEEAVVASSGKLPETVERALEKLDREINHRSRSLIATNRQLIGRAH